MATVKLVSVVEQNANTLAGAQVSSATYVGTNTGAGDVVVRVGREAPRFAIVGTQTASTTYVALDLINAFNGAQVVISRNAPSPGTGIIDVLSGSGQGALVGRIAASTNGVVVAGFDGVANVWR
jgi:hypothetical protein